MPIIDHNEQRMSEVADKRSERDMISAEHGAASLNVSEIDHRAGIRRTGRTPTTPTRPSW